ncbi:hypothetical protein SBRCBS47491_000570 [Sporothrix bragantina]|uniref:RING-type E3 ubiquitin transferase n=1 Tax=Sporothrix bragantina TaxID=671064 RepID=A0ABP0ARF7_9PEZI
MAADLWAEMAAQRPDPYQRHDSPTEIDDFALPPPLQPQHSSQQQPLPQPPAANLDPDTCRICRGEATAQEPLFYPCKCSGSIKYVHQDCLMEWLSHSQKKHCELCKTSFRFTKLYSPNMPKQLPFFVFARHLTKYFLRNLVVWLRISLVACVWLGLLPSLTRWEWSFFFWVSEEGLVYAQLQQQLAAATANGAAENSTTLSSAVAAVTSAATGAASRLANGTASAAVSAAAEQAQADPYGLLEGTRITPFTLISIIFQVMLEFLSTLNLSWIFAQGEDVQKAVFSGPSTLFSEIAFLRNLCRFPVINKLVIFIVEGQFITLLVVVCFILVILVRDYVLQQQPEINMRAAFNAGEEDDLDDGRGIVAGDRMVDNVPEAPPRAHRHRHRHDHRHDIRHNHDHDHDHNNPRHGYDERHPNAFDNFQGAHRGHNGDWDDDTSEWETDSNSDYDNVNHRLRAHAQGPERNGLEFRPIFDNDSHDELNPRGPPVPDTSTTWGPAGRDEVGESSSANANANAITNASANADAASRDSSWNAPGGPGATVHEYMSLYRRAGGDHQRILEIARQEGREEHLQYWLRVMQSVADRQHAERVSTASNDSVPSATTTATDIANDHSASTLMQRSSSKGKQRADTPDDAEDADSSNGPLQKPEAEEAMQAPVSEFEYGLRPRANTDGVTAVHRTNPFANNSWDFGPPPPLPSAAPAAAPRAPPKLAEIAQPGVPYSGRNSSRRFAPMDGVAHATPAVLHRESSDGMAHIDEEVDDAPAPVQTTDVSAFYATTSTSTNLERHQQADEGEWDDVSEDGHAEVEPNNAANAADAANADNDNNDDADANHRDELPRQNGPAIPPPPPAAAPAANDAATAEAEGFLGDLANFMWRDLDNIDPADLPPIPADEDDEDHVALFNEDEDAQEPMDEQDREAFEAAAAAAAAANLEAEAIEDAEDLDGVMELLGMHGPLIGLFQNVVFCGFLVTISLLIGIFMPYNFGRLSVWLAANPMRPVMLLFTLSRILQDMAAFVLGGAAYLTLHVVDNAAALTKLLVGRALPYAEYLAPSLATMWDLCTTSAARVVDNFNIGPPFLSTGEIRNFSAISHEALIMLKGHAATVVTSIGRTLAMFLTGEFLFRLGEALDLAKTGASVAWAMLKALPEVLAHPGSWVITLDAMDPVTINPEYAFWDGIDRSLAIVAGYASMCLVAGLYLHNRAAAFANGAAGPEWEAPLIEGLQQASGVLKVILIIGIEMLVFPLYCGLLLDIALLPLFENTTLLSRLYFSIDYPMTSIFVHWFVGTGYMFHFALFVSMCRKIMRKGVLYFIRDPDDPEFHPVRDVLERSVTTQLRKILFSAFVYGALVIICLGGVVWGLAYAGPNLLPIHYSSNEPVLEFPIDLLFYNLLMPLAIKFFKPSDGLHSMYTWWFRKSARGLRITWFLFGDRHVDEEGILALAPGSIHRQAPWIARQLLMYDEACDMVVPVALVDPREVLASKSASDKDKDRDKTANNATANSDIDSNVATAGTASRNRSRRRVQAEPDMEALSLKKRQLIVSGQLLPDGRFVRAPASDQVKIPKGKTVFLDVTDAGTLIRELEDTALPAGNGINGVNGAAVGPAPSPGALDIYHGKQYQLVYIPPHFRTRVFLFIASIWLFAAVTGVTFTIVPLLFGRRLFRLVLPADVRTNDIYAFSIGIYVLGSASYFVFHARSILTRIVLAAQRRLSAATLRNVAHVTTQAVQRAVQLLYAYFFILVVFPLIATALVELYALIPLHTYMYPPGADASGNASHHTVRIIQSWTLGLLYLKVSTRTITSWYPEARLASAIRAVLRRGNFDPDVRLFTRAFVVPGLVVAAAALGLPLLLAKGWVAASGSAALSSLLPDGPATVVPFVVRLFLPKTVPPPTVADPRLVYRLSFPALALAGLGVWMLWGMAGVYDSLKLRIRDEAYLIGERLHNFGGVPAPPTTAKWRTPAVRA